MGRGVELTCKILKKVFSLFLFYFLRSKIFYHLYKITSYKVCKVVFIILKVTTTQKPIIDTLKIKSNELKILPEKIT